MGCHEFELKNWDVGAEKPESRSVGLQDHSSLYYAKNYPTVKDKNYIQTCNLQVPYILAYKSQN